MDQHQPQEPYHSDSDSSDSIQSTIEYEELTLIAPKKKLNQEDALKFMLSVKITFGGKSEEYAELTQIMKDYRDRRSDINVVRSRIKFLFKEHPELVAGFNIFLPAGYEISVPIQKDYSVSNAVGVEQTVSFVDKVKVEYMHDERR
ncbi:paired amphipathic helix protein Sin3-like 1 isoform X1 [Camellia sinensis]|uniref:paired amphipathic helix protein Sin3-like 1 isoform X1 n=1 Tax=Camellia sinensis TaxID=4442 RepID=UPI0010364C20|nr:paired amphipathic helix protein Sin3-like 1 isoform X1 [Camellia sinensis]XP_028051636.1 paired amphipathic helix protein Sin3-like 1 isoform X1 [Camellia sinensis]XP_028051637.1 paired amphipathic helix protein Sin3-like 1 isoform X1 [Camellia sinensis]